MLDNGTKKRIDSARDILVGKVQDPKSQGSVDAVYYAPTATELSQYRPMGSLLKFRL